jgi:cytochrome c oxidase assembly protein subunit 15
VDAPALVEGRAPIGVRRVYAANLVAQMAIIVTGAVVRLTSSGLGCPTWPRCTSDSVVPVEGQAQQWHSYVEFGNRSLTGVLMALAVASLVAGVWDARRRSRAGLPARTALTWLSAVPLLGTVAQIPLGGITVLTGLNPIAVGSHLLLSLLLVALVTVLVHRADEPGDRPVTVVVRREIRAGVLVLTAIMAVVVVVGMLVTASGPHAGDERTTRLGLDPQTISWLHADLVVLSTGLLVGLLVAIWATDSPSTVRRAAVLALGLFLGQGLLGYVQYFTGLPWVVVAVHVLGATLVWWATVRLLLSTRTRGVLNPL